jgi:hypothetical protein
MDRIRNMAKKIKRSRHKKRDSLGLNELTQEMDYIIGQIDKIQKPDKSSSIKRRNLKTSQYLSKIRNSTSSKYKMKGRNSNNRNSKNRSNLGKNPSHLISSLSKEHKKSENKYSRLEQERQARKLKNFKTMMRSGKLNKSRKLYKEREGQESSLKETNPLKLTSELDDIFKTITSLEQQEFGNTYHKERQKKLKTLMRSSKLADIRKTMNMKRDDSDYWLQSQSDMKSNEHLDKNFTMKKCPKCCLYFPLEKIARHCRNCKK